MTITRFAFIYVLLFMVFANPLHAQADQNSVDDMMDKAHFRVFSTIDGKSGHLEALWVDDGNPANQQSLRFVLGKKDENTHVLSIYLNMKTNKISIRSDYGNWFTISIDGGLILNEYFSIDTSGISYVGSIRFGSARIPLEFNLGKLVSTSPWEAYPLYSSLEDSNGDIIYEDYDIVPLEYPGGPFGESNGVRWSTFLGSLYKWNGWGGKQLDCRLLFSSTTPQDQKRNYYFGSIQLFTYDPETDEISNIPPYDDLKISNVNVVTKEIDGLYKQFINFRVTFENPPPLLLDFNIYEDVDDSGWQPKYGCQITHFYTPTWWLPVIDILK